jgi:peptidoglycan/xylan/chitin deacetylase (PgdA/CDA1 family)
MYEETTSVLMSARSLGGSAIFPRRHWRPVPRPVYGRQIRKALRFPLTRIAGLAMAASLSLTVPSTDEQRSASLVFAEELRTGRVSKRDLARPEVARAVACRPVPVAPIRGLQRLAMKGGQFDFETRNLAPLAAARRAVLGAAAAGPPRFLLRVDEFPLAGAYDESERRRAQFARFHAILTEAGVPYMMAVTPAVARDYLDPSGTLSRPLSDRELATLDQLRRDGVTFALHGYDHRTRDARPRHRSELVGLEVEDLRALLAVGTARLADAGIRPRVFVPPFNRFEARQYDVLAERYQVVCGGPETVPLFGFHRTPLWRGEAVYMPVYAPFYERSKSVAAATDRAIAAQAALWIPMVLHWSWEAEGGWADLERLARKLAGYARPWDEFLAA